MQISSEAAIIEKAKDGDRRSFRMLVERYQALLYSVACRFLGKDDAEDAVQEVFIRLWKNFHKYRPEVKLSTWLYRIVTNICLDQLKSKQRRKWFKMVDINKTYKVQDTSRPDKELEKKELMQYILKIANSLTPKQRAVFVLRDLEGLPSEQVGDILSMKSGSVKSNLYYARQKMHDKIIQHFDLTTKRVIS